MAIFYLALHKIVARMSRKPDSKLLWFFGVVTAPLILPVKKWSSPDATESQIISYALLFYLPRLVAAGFRRPLLGEIKLSSSFAEL